MITQANSLSPTKMRFAHEYWVQLAQDKSKSLETKKANLKDTARAFTKLRTNDAIFPSLLLSLMLV